jgi:hypothetical protein
MTHMEARRAMARPTGGAIDLREHLEGSLGQIQQPGVRELCELLSATWRPILISGEAIRLEPLKNEVYRLRIGSQPDHAVVLKRLAPAIAQTDRLVAERWLPALGLGDRCPQLLGAAAARDGCWIWHVYEDLGHDTLAADRQSERLGAAVDLLAELHTRAAIHPLLPEVRWRARDHGAHFFTASLRDAIGALEAMAVHPQDVPTEFSASRARLLRWLHQLQDDAPRRIRVIEELGGPDTLLHGDLWPKNVFVTRVGTGPRARLIDWDHVGVGPATYDLSTFLYRSSAEERPWILQRYREAVERDGWRLPGNGDLNLLFHTAESARCVHCVLFDAMAVHRDGAEWAIAELMDYERWLEALRAPLSD